ncbi:unnamed protein product [Caenorhabditis auriculariae]|uniref:non-specific serine/threonine protein kinase n=1 Tax=Caenorhabditis auriculariae TaxID=2777116 RepID=A0A8S1HEY2_9PELO|nr:unnamed protein product [Caenorhabditis auriculariae]
MVKFGKGAARLLAPPKKVMPLGFFGKDSGKPQPLTGTSSTKEKKEAPEKDCRGSVIRLQNATVIIEKKLAEGGFAIVYLVTDRKNRQFALKRQFINDDPKHVEACMRECKIVCELNGHKNIVGYVDHLITQSRNGIYDCMLLTAYYKASVLQLMNDRLAAGQGLSSSEVLSIFCDMNEAVARLHHSQTPVIHRDLKVENILIDERNRAAPPTYVLCDFGSATTKVLSTETHAARFVQDEIERYTTLSYRAPEMVDIYAGKSIGTKSDMWALGVMLYKLCYFALPFGESAMAIQNGTFSFPPQPEYPLSIKSIIHCLLDADITRRLSIFECASLAFQAIGSSRSPVEDVYREGAPSLEEVIAAFSAGRPRDVRRKSVPSTTPAVPPTGDLCSTEPSSGLPLGTSATTSVNPRLRPKPMASVPVVPVLTGNSKSHVPPQIRALDIAADSTDLGSLSDSRLITSGDISQLSSSAAVSSGGPLSCPLIKPADLGFTDLDEALLRGRAATDATRLATSSLAVTVEVQQAETTHASLPSVATTSANASQQHRRNASDTSQMMRSAFKPYSQTAAPSSPRREGGDGGVWNPFLSAPFPPNQAMDDQHFGKYFDELPRRTGTADDADDDTSSIDSRDPFGAAPFDLPAASTASSRPELVAARLPTVELDGETQTDGRKNTVDEDSELDEQRMKARRRFSYENIDGVGDDASSDSRGRTDHDSTDETSRNGDTSHDEDAESSQHTDVAGSDDGGGSRPLLEDDGLEDDDDHELLEGYHCVRISDVRGPLFVDATVSQTNPFLRAAEETPKTLSPAAPFHVPATSPTFTPQWGDENVATDGGRWGERRDTVFEKSIYEKETNFAPATLPRQSTPLAAVPRFPTKPDLPLTAPVSIESSSQPAVGTLIQVGTPTVVEPRTVGPIGADAMGGPTSTTTAFINVTPLTAAITTTATIVPAKVPSPQPRKPSVPTFIEGPKTPKPKTKSSTSSSKKKEVAADEATSSAGSNLETDGSEAEMFTSTSSDKTSSALRKKKKTSTFGMRSSHPNVVAAGVAFSSPVPPVVKKSSKEKKSSSTKRGSTGVLNASFVNNSFQAEDVDSTTL